MARLVGSYSTTAVAPLVQRMWQSMRVMRRFTTADLEATADAGESAVGKYVRALGRAGYLRVVKPRVSGRPGSRDLWALVRDTGPLAPIRQEDGSGVYDRNTGVRWGREGLPLASADDHDAVARALLAKWRDSNNNSEQAQEQAT